jgi:hypothetical protein
MAYLSMPTHPITTHTKFKLEGQIMTRVSVPVNPVGMFLSGIQLPIQTLGSIKVRTDHQATRNFVGQAQLYIQQLTRVSYTLKIVRRNKGYGFEITATMVSGAKGSKQTHSRYLCALQRWHVRIR